MATNDDIAKWFDVLRSGANSIAGADLDEPERTQLRMLATAALCIFQSVVVDINNIAFFMAEEDARKNRQ